MINIPQRIPETAIHIPPTQPNRHNIINIPQRIPETVINIPHTQINQPPIYNTNNQQQTQITTPFMFIEKDKENKYLKPISQEKLFEMNQELFRKRKSQRILPANRYKRKIYKVSSR